MTNYTIRIEMYTKHNDEAKLEILATETVKADVLEEAKDIGFMLACETHDFFKTCDVTFSKSQYWFKPLVHVRGECKSKKNRPDGLVSAAIMIYWEK